MESNLSLSEKLGRAELEKTRAERDNAGEIMRLQFEIETQQVRSVRACACPPALLCGVR